MLSQAPGFHSEIHKHGTSQQSAGSSGGGATAASNPKVTSHGAFSLLLVNYVELKHKSEFLGIMMIKVW